MVFPGCRQLGCPAASTFRPSASDCQPPGDARSSPTHLHAALDHAGGRIERILAKDVVHVEPSNGQGNVVARQVYSGGFSQQLACTQTDDRAQARGMSGAPLLLCHALPMPYRRAAAQPAAGI